LVLVADVHFNVIGNVDHGSGRVAVGRLVGQLQSYRAADDDHIDVGVGKMLGQSLSFIKDHVIDSHILIVDDFSITLSEVRVKLKIFQSCLMFSPELA